MAEHEEGHEGMSTTKKVAAGAAVGIAVPAAVGVARKLMSSDDDSDETGGRATGTRSQSATTRRRSSPTKSRRTSTSSKASSRSRGSARPRGETTKEQLYRQAQRLKIDGRSKMSKSQLQRAVNRARP